MSILLEADLKTSRTAPEPVGEKPVNLNQEPLNKKVDHFHTEDSSQVYDKGDQPGNCDTSLKVDADVCHPHKKLCTRMPHPDRPEETKQS